MRKLKKKQNRIKILRGMIRLGANQEYYRAGYTILLLGKQRMGNKDAQVVH
jgi:hypothetical protein